MTEEITMPETVSEPTNEQLGNLKEAIKSHTESVESKAEAFAKISKQEKFLRAERAKIEEARRAFDAEKQKAESYNRLSSAKDPFEILEHFGITYEQLLEADQKRANPIDPTVKKALDKVQELENRLKAKEEEAIQERRTKAEMQLRAEITKTIKEQDYDIIELAGAEQSVIDYMEEIYNQTGKVIPAQEACDAVTNALVEQYQKVSKSKRLQPKVEQPKVEMPKEPTKTLTNKMTQSSTKSSAPMTEQERIKAALALMP
jgi:hypothetical protein